MTLDKKKTIYLIDGSSFLYRSYYAMQPLHTATGEPVQAVYNFCRMIYKLANSYKPHYMALVWDSKGKTQRHELYAAYKATRQEPPSDLFTQKERIIEFADLIGLKSISIPGVEADDIMMALANQFAQQGASVVLVTADKDMGQVLSDTVYLLDPFKNTLYNAENFEQERGIPVDRISFYYALLGDSSDNIPGVRGIGKKSALELVQQFETLEHLYANVDQITSQRVRNALERGKENAFLSHMLFLPQPVAISYTFDDLSFDLGSWPKARSFFAALGFVSLVEKLDTVKAHDTTSISGLLSYMNQYDLVCVTTQVQLERLAHEVYAAGVCAIDTETDALDPMRATMVGLSVCCSGAQAYYIPVAHKNAKQLSLEQVRAALGPVLADPGVKKYFHNAKYDLHVLDRAGFVVNNFVFDTLIAARLIAKPWQKLNLKGLAQHYLQDIMLTFKQIIAAGPYKNFADVPLDLATKYGASDALETYRLRDILYNELQEEGVYDLFSEIEQPLVTLLFHMERVGICVDTAQLGQLSRIVMQELELTKIKILGFVGMELKDINLNSSRQVAHLLFEVLQLSPQKKGKTGYSTDQSVLESLATVHPVAGLLLRYRELSKLKTTYLDALPEYVLAATNKIHTTFNQTAVATGRLSSSDPNLQNIPADGTAYGKQVRDAFIPDPGCAFISADYSQIELRVLAQLSQDMHLVSAFTKGADVHVQTAAHLFDVSEEQVTHEQRQIGKRINFSILYGQTPYGLSRELGISFSDAKQYIERYLEQYQGVTRWMDSIVAFAKKHGYVQTLWGRKRYVPNIHEANQVLYNEAKRIAINTVAQGTAADIIKIAMLKLNKSLAKEYPDAEIILQIHDELLLSVDVTMQEVIAHHTKQVLESVVDWNVPLVVSVRSGDSWGAVSK